MSLYFEISNLELPEQIQHICNEIENLKINSQKNQSGSKTADKKVNSEKGCFLPSSDSDSLTGLKDDVSGEGNG